ncbi:MAG TPA: 30S ribosomal protein S17 [Candidatus Mcinerneyibacterium sp.]|nr:30S ribosomal protein S17 [Candidatus Mcinerneyibacterium sp.]
MKKNRKKFEGIVISDKMDKSITVEIERKTKDKLTGKILRRHKKYMAHDEENKCEIGDTVLIEETSPISKRKKWRVAKIVEKHK